LHEQHRIATTTYIVPCGLEGAMGKSLRERIEAMLAESPDDPLLRYDLAMQYVSGGDNAGAVERFADLLRLAPDYVPGYMQYGLTLQRLDRLAEAKSIWETGIAAARKQGDAHAADEMAGMVAGLD
jgi:tetratricopeptide (TPR) repeat protein